MGLSQDQQNCIERKWHIQLFFFFFFLWGSKCIKEENSYTRVEEDIPRKHQLYKNKQMKNALHS